MKQAFPPVRRWRALAAVLAVLLSACAGAPPASKPAEALVFPAPPDEVRFYFERSIYSSADVVKDERNGELKRLLTGESRAGDGLGKPYGVAVRHGRVFVSDTALHNVIVYDIPKEEFRKVGDDEVGKLMTPMGLDVDGAGNLYVLDSGAKLVQVYDEKGKYVRTIGAGKYFKRPSGLAVDRAGTRVYVVDTGGVTNEEHRVLVFDVKSGNHLLDIGKRGSGPGELNLPRDVTVAPDGTLYVVDGANFRVQAFKPDGSFIRSFGGVGRQSGQFSRPKEVATDTEGNVYVVDSAFGNFQIFNPDGKLLLAVGGRSERDGPAKYMLPSGIAVDDDGRVYVVDQYYRKVDVYRPAKLAATAGYAVPAAAPAAPAVAAQK